MISIEGAGDGGGRGVFSAIPPLPVQASTYRHSLSRPPTPLAVVTRFLLNEVIYRGKWHRDFVNFGFGAPVYALTHHSSLYT
jgi:hypothetical protein